MSANPLFEQTVTALLAGEIICEYRYDSLYNYMTMPGNQQQVAAFLSQINRVLRRTGSNDAWLCAFEDTTSKAVKDSIRNRFDEVANNLEPLVHFLRLIMATEGNERPVSPGDSISEGHILERISSAPSLESKLRSLTESQYFKSRKPDSAGQLRVVMGNLEKAGYLKRKGTTGSLYLATGKWSWLYDLMTFIQTHEGIADSGFEDDQQGRIF